MQSSKQIYQCPMHPEVTSDKPGSCPKCGMKLVETEMKMDMDHEKIRETLKNVKELWLNEYFHVSSLYIFMGAFIANIILIRK